MIRHVKRYFAIRSYVMRLSHELARPFEKRPVYSVEHVTKAVQKGKFSPAFIAYAHAAFCSKADFDAHYEPLGVSCNYDDLRRTMARRYLGEDMEFDAATLRHKYRSAQQDGGDQYESGIGLQ